MFQYMMAMQELEAMATPSSSKDEGEKEQPVPKPSNNNTEEATKYLKAVTTLLDNLQKTFMGSTPVPIEMHIRTLYII